MSTSGPDPKVTDERLIDCIQSDPRPFATVTTVTERVALGRERVRQRLNRLSRQERIHREKISGSVGLYWLEESSSER